MRRSNRLLGMIAICALICVGLFTHATPAYAASITYTTSCEISGGFAFFGTITIAPAGSYPYTYVVKNLTTGDVYNEAGVTNPIPTIQYYSGSVEVNSGNVIEVTLDIGSEGRVVIYPCGGAPVGGPSFTDGRLNAYDPGQTVAIYCTSDGSVKVMWIDDASKGHLAFVSTPAEIAKVPTSPAVNTAIESGNGATLYRLTSGELQVNRAESKTGKVYQFIFNDCPQS